MGSATKNFRYRGNRFFFDCQFCDDQLDETSYSFGSVREIYIRDCYFKWHSQRVFDNAKIVVDIGANRGAFSTLVSTTADFVLSVECGKQYSPIIKHNFSINNFCTYAIENAFIGSGGTVESDSPQISMNDLLDRHNLVKVDFLKLDIEGCEFSLFEKPDWLHRIHSMSMEVHTDEGDPARILRVLKEYGFACKVADENLLPTSDLSMAGFIYAWRDPI